MLYIGSDHGGFALKEDLKKYLSAGKTAFVDVGPKKADPKDDYPEFSVKVARQVSKNPQKNRGILICRSGHGVCIVANKYKNVRAALCWNELLAKYSRDHDDANILCLPSDYISTDAAENIVKIWMATPFSYQQRHIRRLREINNIEKKLY